MLRRVARVLRWLLVLLGAVFFLSLLLSTVCYLQILISWPRVRAFIWLGNGGVRVHAERPGWNDSGVFIGGPIWDIGLPVLVPSFVHGPVVTEVCIPLWLLAVLCLAWPVTFFVIARRRRGTRGFEVEPSQRTEVGTAKHGVVKDEG